MIFTAIGTAIAGALFAGSALAATLITGALTFAAKLAFSYLTRPKKRSYSAVAGESQIGGAVPVSTLFGPGKTQGQRLFYAKYGSGNKLNAEVFRLAHGWCDGLEPYVYFYGEKYDLVARPIIGNEIAHYGVSGFDSLISIRFYDGRPGQLADAKLVADTAALGQTWKSTSSCAGMTYVVVERQYDTDKFSKGRPTFDFVLRGLREYDPRKDSTVAGGSGPQRLNDLSTWVYTTNPAVHRLNYQLGLRGLVSGRTLIGEGKSLGQLDLSTYFASMNVCDTLRKGKPTYACGLWATSDDDHTEILAEFEDAMAGYALNRRGLSGVLAGAPQIPVLEITADDIPLDRARPDTQYDKSAFELYNQLSGQFTSIETMWQPESLKPIIVNADVAADGAPRGTSNDFLQVTDPDIAQYLLNIRYRQNRKGGSQTLPVSRRVGLKVMEGEWVTLEGQEWLIKEWQVNEQFQFTLVLAETGADIYDDGDIPAGPIIVPPSAPINPSILSTVQNFRVEVGLLKGKDGYEQPTLRFAWDPPSDPTITAVRFFYFVGTDPTGQTIYEDQTTGVESGLYVTSKNVQSGVFYTARATITTVPDRFKTFTPWVTTAELTGNQKVYPDGLVDEINQHTADMMAPLNVSIRDQIEQARQIALAAMNQDAGQYLDRQQSLTQVKSVFDTITADYRLLVTAATGPGSAIVQRLETLEATIPGLATVQALNSLTLTVAAQAGDIEALGTSISGVQAAVNDSLASGMFRTYVEATQAGALSTIGISAAASSGGATSQAAILISAIAGNKSMIGLVADQVYFTDGAGNKQYPFVFENGAARMNVANIGTITTGLIQAPTGKHKYTVATGTMEWWD